MLVATAGHIDHGKTLLVKALTGVDTDRLPEEKARGISIELGFAYPKLAGGERLDFIDVPGHERFVRNMLAGVAGIDFALVVVAADDGVMPQTIEHVQILDLLGVKAGAVAITKIDRVNEARVAEVKAEVAALLAATPLAGSAAYPVSAVAGTGIDALRAALAAAARAHAASSARYSAARRFRLAVDRVFTVAGSGTVVTGTVFDGEIRRGDRALVAPRGVPSRIRGIQSRGQSVEAVRAGERAALNLADVERDAVVRGDWIVAPALERTTRRLDVRLRLVREGGRPLAHWTPVHLHLGTADVVARVGVPGSVTISSGAEAVVQLILAEPVVALVGDRFIVRDQSARHTLGGGVVIDPFAPATRRNSAARAAVLEAFATLDPQKALARLLALGDRPVDLERFGASFGLTDEALAGLVDSAGAAVLGKETRVAVLAVARGKVQEKLLATLAEHHRAQPQAAGFELAELARTAAPQWPAEAVGEIARALADARRVQINGSRLRIAGHDATSNPADEKLWQRVVPALMDAGLNAPTVIDLARALAVAEPILKSLLHRKQKAGELVRLGDDRFYLRATFASFAATATALANASPAKTFTAAEFRDAVGIGRNIVIKILEALDTIGITMRVGDVRKARKDFVPILGPAQPIAAKRK